MTDYLDARNGYIRIKSRFHKLQADYLKFSVPDGNMLITFHVSHILKVHYIQRVRHCKGMYAISYDMTGLENIMLSFLG